MKLVLATCVSVMHTDDKAERIGFTPARVSKFGKVLADEKKKQPSKSFENVSKREYQPVLFYLNQTKGFITLNGIQLGCLVAYF